MKFSELQIDFLKEVFNLGLGKAAAEISKLAKDKYELVLDLPTLEFTNLSNIIEHFDNSNQALSAVSQEYTGPVDGRISMIYSDRATLELISLFLGKNIPPTKLANLESDALKEAGCHLINACVSSMSSVFIKEFDTELPFIYHGNAKHVLIHPGEPPDKQVIFVKSDFHIESINLNGYISILIECDSIDKLINLIDSYHSKLLGEIS